MRIGLPKSPRLLPACGLLAIALPLLFACNNSSSGSTFVLTLAEEPEVQMDPNGVTPLAGRLTVSSVSASTVSVTISDGVRSWTIQPPGFREDHVVTLAGMRAATSHVVTVVVTDSFGLQAIRELLLNTPPLPPEFPLLDVKVAESQRVEPGFTMFSARWSDGPNNGSFLIWLDNEGQVVWYHADPNREVGDAEMLRNGNLLIINTTRSAEIDLLGTVLAEWYSTRKAPDPFPPGAVLVDTEYFHHEFTELPESEEADFLALSLESRHYPDYPTDVVDPSITEPSGLVVGDVLIEFKRDGTIVRETHLLDILDPYRMCYSTLGAFYVNLYGARARDWSHGNSVQIDPSDNTYIVSLRHQDAVVKIHRDTGELVWILGDHGRWNAPWDQYLLTPIGSPFEWQFHQHAPELDGAGNLVLFDNGNFRVVPPAAFPPDDQLYSRAVTYRIDAAAMTVEQLWDCGGPAERWYSSFLGDADPQPGTSNVLVTDGGRKDAPTDLFARVFEVTRDSPAELVFEVVIREFPNPTRAWRIYRAEKIGGY